MIHECVPGSSTVYTPAVLAAAMVRAAGDAPECVWLDPCVGDGAFVAEMSAIGIPAIRIRAVEISPNAAVCDAFARTERSVDFVEWAGRHPNCADRVIMNPPYAALNRIRGLPLERALNLRFSDGKTLPLRANYWCAFILGAIRCLRTGGTLVAVLPAAWDFAQYAERVRKEVCQSFREVSVVRCTTPLFPTVREGVVVVVARGMGEPHRALRRVEVSDMSSVVRALDDVSQNRIPSGAVVVRSMSPPANKDVRLDDLIRIRIGAVTGDAGYFLLTETERIDLGLPQSAVHPVLSRYRHLTAAVMTDAAWTHLRNEGERVWLFRPTGTALAHAAVIKYLAGGLTGACNIKGFKVSSRDLWHRTPLPSRIHGFISGMSKRLPFLILRGMTNLTATNTLYVVQFKSSTNAADRASLGIALLTSRVRREMASYARVYADGLFKFEPTELGKIRVPIVKSSHNAQDIFRQATTMLLSGRSADAEALADAWVAGASPGAVENVDSASDRCDCR